MFMNKKLIMEMFTFVYKKKQKLLKNKKNYQSKI